MDRFPNGVSAQSESFFFTPSSLAKRMLFYQLFCGHFYCDQHYNTRRDNYGCYLLIYVASGECYAHLPKRSFSAGAGELIWIDCHQPHEYGCHVRSELYWLHFDGAGAAEFYDAAEQLHGELFSRKESAGMGAFLRENLDFFLESPPEFAMGNPMGEIAFSSRLYQELCGLLACMPEVSPGDENAINLAQATICTHFGEPLTVEALAEQSHMSTAYFSRLFKKKTGSSPYEYLIRHRINHAKHLLRNSEQSIEEVSFTCGFNSVTNFIYTFSRRTGMSPGKFRKIQF